MDDFNISSLQESRNEWTSRLVTLLIPCIFNGFKTIFEEAQNLSINEKQKEKYLMIFQNLLIQIPKWNNEIIKTEVDRIINVTQCSYIEDLITCVHIIQLKALTCVRVGQNEKNVNINIPKIHDFIHRIYINAARNIYSNIYLFEKDILPLQIQQNYNKVDNIIKDAIIESVRQSMPIDEILRAYLEDSVTENSEKIAENSEKIAETIIESNNSNNLLDSVTTNDINVEPDENAFSIENKEQEKTIDSNAILSESDNLMQEIDNIDSKKENTVSFAEISADEDDNIKILNDISNEEMKLDTLPTELIGDTDNILGVEVL